MCVLQSKANNRIGGAPKAMGRPKGSFGLRLDSGWDLNFNRGKDGNGTTYGSVPMYVPTDVPHICVQRTVCTSLSLSFTYEKKMFPCKHGDCRPSNRNGAREIEVDSCIETSSRFSYGRSCLPRKLVTPFSSSSSRDRLWIMQAVLWIEGRKMKRDSRGILAALLLVA